ncbi:MAG: hypothetical protein ACREL7_12615 [Longimicrobiales bacterium]
MHRPQGRRTFLAFLGFAFAGLMGAASPERAAGAPLSTRRKHPDPRPGIDASRVLARDRVSPDVADLFDQIREIPQIADGIRCQCGCADVEGMYSLLSCYEEPGMAQHCEICQRVGRLVHRQHREHHTLDEIRAAVDQRFG